MDFSEKDAARSKFRHSRKHQPRGRGRGRGWTTSRARQAPQDLGSNWDRYDDGEDEDQLAEGPVRRSQGADLAEWAAQHPPQDPLFFARLRVNLNQDVGLPPAEPDAFQGLSFDLQGLAACLRALPLSDVLRLPPGLAGEERGSGDDGNGEGIEDVHGAAAIEKKEEAKIAAIAPPPSPPPVAPPVASAPLSKPAPAPPKPAPAAPPPANLAPIEDEDAELEALLGLGAAPAPSATGAGQSNTNAGEGDSLEAWLDTL